MKKFWSKSWPKDSRYQRDAYLFLRDALEYTQKQRARNAGTEVRAKASCKATDKRNVSGQELLDGIREYALEEFGPMAITVFEEWGIRSCEDFGEMVFIMVEHQLLARKPNRTRWRISRTGYDFDDAFRKPFLPRQKQTAKTPTQASPS